MQADEPADAEEAAQADESEDVKEAVWEDESEDVKEAVWADEPAGAEEEVRSGPGWQEPQFCFAARRLRPCLSRSAGFGLC